MSDQTLIERMKLKENLDQKMANSISSCGVILQMFNVFSGVLDDADAHEIQALIPNSMDLRSQENYFLLIFAVSKVLYICVLQLIITIYSIDFTISNPLLSRTETSFPWLCLLFFSHSLLPISN